MLRLTAPSLLARSVLALMFSVSSAKKNESIAYRRLSSSRSNTTYSGVCTRNLRPKICCSVGWQYEQENGQLRLAMMKNPRSRGETTSICE